MFMGHGRIVVKTKGEVRASKTMSTQETTKETPVSVKLLANSEASLQQIRQDLSSIAGVSVAVNGSVSISGAPGSDSEDALMVELGPNREEELHRMRILRAGHKKSALIAILKDRSADMMKKVLQGGADDILFWPLDPAPTTRTLLKIVERRERQHNVRSGKLCAIASTIGGVGVTSVTANLALALRYAFEKRVAIVDLDFRSSGLSSYLSLEPVRNISWLGTPGRTINSIELGTALTAHSSGIQVLAAPDFVDGESITEEVIAKIYGLMRQLFDYVIIDCGGAIDKGVGETWKQCDQLLYVMEQSVNGIRCAWRFGQLFEQTKVSLIKPQYVINRFDPSHPAGVEQITYALSDSIFARIPADPRAMQRREARGVDLWHASPGSPVISAYEELAEAVISGKASIANPSAAMIPRLLAAVGARQNDNVNHVS
jgi:pilus assembly protein CpaE